MSASASKNVAFASQAMMDILRAGAKLNGFVIEPTANAVNQSKVPITSKRALLQAFVDKYGIENILKLGQGVSQLLHTPLSMALLVGSEPQSLLSKWHRLERYVHALHYTESDFSQGQINIKHLSRGEELPTLVEDLAVMSVLCALLSYCGASKITLSGQADSETLLFDFETQTTLCESIQACSSWVIRYEPCARHKQNSLPLFANEDEQALLASWQSKVEQAIIATGFVETTIDKVAMQLCVSARSLQRHLQQENLKFAQLLQQERVKYAAKLLMQKQTSLAEIGFLCGFSDQAHFTRIFSQCNGMTPKAYLEMADTLPV